MTRFSPWIFRPSRRGGFALIITLTLMVLLVILVTGLLSLSAVGLRSVGNEAARTQARSNARLALMLAFSQLQQQTGSDTRITAPADVLTTASASGCANPSWRGVWKSNPATSRSYKPARADFFSGWLVTAAGTPLPLDAARSPVSGAAAVIRKTPGGPDVTVPLMTIANHGRLGWWTDDESLKARANLPLLPPTSKGAAAVVGHAAGRMAPESVPGPQWRTDTADKNFDCTGWVITQYDNTRQPGRFSCIRMTIRNALERER